MPILIQKIYQTLSTDEYDLSGLWSLLAIQRALTWRLQVVENTCASVKSKWQKNVFLTIHALNQNDDIWSADKAEGWRGQYYLGNKEKEFPH